MRGRRPGLMVSVGRSVGIRVARRSTKFCTSMRVVCLYLFFVHAVSLYLSFLSFLLFMYVWSLARCFILLATTYMLPRAYLHLYSTSRHLSLFASLRLSRSLSLARHALMLTRATHIRVHHVVILVQTQIQTNAYSRVASAARSSCAEARSRDLGTRTRACAGTVSVQYGSKWRGAPVLSSIGPARLGAPGCLWQ